MWSAVGNRTYAEPESAELAYLRIFFDLKQLNTAIAAELFPNVERGDRRTLVDLDFVAKTNQSIRRK